MKLPAKFHCFSLLAGFFAFMASTGALALTDLSTVPLTTSANNNNSPNLLFILDDSDSMNYVYMPDLVGRPPEGAADDTATRRTWVGFRNSQCNLLYYDPAKTYITPRNHLGNLINDPAGSATATWGGVATSFAAAHEDGYYHFYGVATPTQTNLSTSFKAHPSDTAQAAYYWRYAVAGSLKPLDAACKQPLSAAGDATTTQICTDGTRLASPATCSGAGKTLQWEKVVVSATSGPGSTDERQNYANWYSYARNRMNLMKTASGEAFRSLSDSFRVGFITINPGSPVADAKFLKVDKFTESHKSAWFRKLYGQTTDDATPLLRALSRAGRYFAGKTDGINDGMIGTGKPDPITSSCQQNFAFLTTDGYWNKEGGVDLAGSALLVNQDGNLAELDAYNATASKFLVSPRPIYDGNTRYSWKTAAVQYRDNTACTYPQAQQREIQHQTRTVQNQRLTIQNQTRTTQLQTRTTQLQQRTVQNQRRTIQNQRRQVQNQMRTTQLQTRTDQLQTRTTQLQKRTVQNQRRTIQNQRKITQLQTRTTQLQETSTQLQKQTKQIQRRTVQNQSKTTQLQKRTQQLQQRTARFRACSGTGGTGSCVGLTFDCAGGTLDASRPYCYVTNDTGWSNVSSCTATASETSVTLCQWGDTGWVNSGTCTASSTASTIITCQTVDPGWVNVGTCTAAAINGSGQTVTCQVASDSGWANAASCTASNPASGPTVTCQTPVTAAWANAGTCTAGTNASGVVTECQTLGPTTVNAGSCTVAAINASGKTVTGCTTTNPSWTNTGSCTAVPINASGATVECQTTNPAWSNVGTCTAAPINGSGQTTLCQVASDTGWVNVGTCSASNPASGPTVTCQTASDTGWVNAGTCTASNPASGPTITCQTTSPAWTNVGTCTAVPINASGATVQCQTATGTWTNTGTCTPAPINGSGQTVLCQTTTSAWSNVGTCTPVPINASGAATECQVASDSGWVNIGTCTPSNPASGPTTTCQVASDSGWVNIGTCSASNPASGPTVTCQTASDTGWVNAGSCSASNPAAGPTITCQTNTPAWSNTGSCTSAPINGSGATVECQTVTPAWSNVGSCTPAAINVSGATVQCQEASNSGWVNVGSCAASNPAAGPTVTCQVASDTGFVNSGTCSASNPASGPTVTCQTTSDSGWFNVASCTPDSTASPAVTCQTVNVPGHQLQYRSQITETIYRGQNQTDTNYGSTTGAWSGWTDLAVCSATVPTVPANGAAPTAGPPTPPSGCTEWPCETAVNTYGSSESLADVAQYYYKTDLRTSALGNCGSGADLCANNINAPEASGTYPLEGNLAKWQHMVTFTLGLGVSGSLTYDSAYRGQVTAGSGDFYRLRVGEVDWPVPVRKSAGVDPNEGLVNGEYAVDDLWHAAVNGRGRYFSASSASQVKAGIDEAVKDIEATSGSATGAASTAQNLVTGTVDLAFVATYKTKDWIGSLRAFALDSLTGQMNATAVWDAQAKLDAKVKAGCDERNIKLFRSGATNNLVDFKLGSYVCAAGVPSGSAVTTLNATEQAFFDSTVLPGLSQYPLMSSSQRTAAAGANLVNFLRGQTGKEGFTESDDNKLFRDRASSLGDIVYSAPVFVKAPFGGYDDPGYATFKANQASRVPMVYVGANDGMLHAFHAGGASDLNAGNEAWAFIPTFSLPKLYKLASEGYGNDYVAFIDGTPVVNDICASDCAAPTPPAASTAVWKTILVSGLRNGGKGYFALDVTDPAVPKALWEFKWSDACFDSASLVDQFTDCHVGLSYGDPVIAKLEDGRWVVFVTSGYNNVNDPVKSGDGQGYLYVLEATTGKILYKIGTGAGSSTNVSGLAHISARSVETLRDNTAKFIYGTDLLGNVWRFDVNNLISPSGVEASLLATLVDSLGNAQPITTKPQLGVVGTDPWVYVGTGQYLGEQDLNPANYKTQSVWGIKDPLTSTAVTNLRSTFKKVVTTTVGGETSTTAYRTSSCSERCTATDGWFVDLPASGERVNIDMKLDLGTLLVASNLPPASACEIGGSSWLNFFDASTGLAVAGSLNASTGSRVLNALGQLTQVVGINIIRTATGEVKVQASTFDAGISNPYVAFSTPAPTGKRVTWREIIVQ